MALHDGYLIVKLLPIHLRPCCVVRRVSFARLPVDGVDDPLPCYIAQVRYDEELLDGGSIRSSPVQRTDAGAGIDAEHKRGLFGTGKSGRLQPAVFYGSCRSSRYHRKTLSKINPLD